MKNIRSKYLVSEGTLLKHWMALFMKHVFPRLLSPQSPGGTRKEL